MPMMPTDHGFAHTVAIRLRNAAIASVCGTGGANCGASRS